MKEKETLGNEIITFWSNFFLFSLSTQAFLVISFKFFHKCLVLKFFFFIFYLHDIDKVAENLNVFFHVLNVFFKLLVHVERRAPPYVIAYLLPSSLFVIFNFLFISSISKTELEPLTSTP